MTQCSIGPTFWAVSVLGAVLLTAATSPTAAQDIGDASEGHQLAATWCLIAILWLRTREAVRAMEHQPLLRLLT